MIRERLISLRRLQILLDLQVDLILLDIRQGMGPKVLRRLRLWGHGGILGQWSSCGNNDWFSSWV
jgi:hypothetical protein